MSTPNRIARRTLPSVPSLEHLRKQARDLQRDHRNGQAEALQRARDNLPRLADTSAAEIDAAVVSRTDAQLILAREYGFASWPRLVQAVDGVDTAPGAMKAAIEQGDAAAITTLLQGNPALRDQTFQWTDDKDRQRSITPIRYAHACDQQASFAALRDAGADMSQFQLALSNNAYNLNLPRVQQLLARGVDPNRSITIAQTRLGPRRYDVVNALIDAGADFEDDARMDIHRGHLDRLETRLRENPALLSQLFVDCLDTPEAMRRPQAGVTPPRGTLLHIAAAHNDAAVVRHLLGVGADIDVRAPEGEDCSCGRTPIYFTIGRAMASGPSAPPGWPAYETCAESFDLLLDEGADLAVRATFPGQPSAGQLTPLGYALACRASQQGQAPRPQLEETEREIHRLRALSAPE